jgi:phosphodiesterase/alkaline phosphatase D-like protein
VLSRLRLGWFVGLTVLAFLSVAAPAMALNQPSPVVISQFRTNEPNTLPGPSQHGDFVELMNISGASVTLQAGAWTIFNIEKTDGNQCSISSGSPQLTLAPGQRYLLTQPGWDGTAVSDQTFTSCGGLIDDAGVLDLQLGPSPSFPFGLLGSDQAAYGPIPGNAGVPPGNQGTFSLEEPDSIPAPLPSDGRSLQRKPVGTPAVAGRQDTQSNKTDFQAVTADPEGLAATAPAPGATTNGATNIASKTATLNGTANPHGAGVTDCHFEIRHGITTLPNVPCASTPSGQTDVNVSAAATGLDPTTQYQYKLVVSTGASRSTSASEQSFTTTIPDPGPTGSTGTASPAGSQTATLIGSVNPNGGTISDCHFEYGKSGQALSLQAPCATNPTGNNSATVAANVTDLDPASDYVYRLVVSTQNPPTLTGANSAVFHTLTLVPDTDKVVISEFRSMGTGGDFVQLMNTTNATVSMKAGWTLTNTNSSGSSCQILAPIGGPAVTLAPGQHYLIAGFTGADIAFAVGSGRCGSVIDTNATLSLGGALDSSNQSLGSDAVSYGSVASGAEGPAIAAVPGDGRVLQRRNSGRQDTHRSIDDFHAVTDTPAALAAGAPVPTVTTTAASTITKSTAALHGTVNPNGGTVTTCRFDYGPTPSYGLSVACSVPPPASTTSPVAVSAPISGLAISSGYHYQLVVTTTPAGGTANGGDQAFSTTVALPAPEATTGTATKVAASTATLRASVNPHGATVSDCHFEFGTDTSYSGTSVPCSTTPTGDDPVAVSGPVTDLTPSTAYHFRIRVTTANGPLSTNDDSSFSTNAAVPDTDQVVISQFRTRGMAGGDFVELLNISNQAVNLNGWSLFDVAADGSSQCGIVSNGPALTLAPGQHYLITQSGWTGTIASDRTFSTCGDLGDASGVLELNGGGSDAVAYGVIPAQGTTVPEPDPIATAPNDGSALQRRDGGLRDTGNNFDDFHSVTANPQNFFAAPVAAHATSDPATNVGSVKATFNGTVTPSGQTITGCQFEWGTDADFATATDATRYPHTVSCDTTPSGLATVAVSATQAGLTPSSVYHYKLVANASTTGPIAGSDVALTTTVQPSAITGSVTPIGSRTATASGTVNPRGENVTNCHFDVGTAANNYNLPSAACSSTPSGNADAPVAASLTGLSPSTEYHVRAHITTSTTGDHTGGDQVFNTTSVPSASTDAATNPGHTAATLNGTVNPHGEPVTNCHFEYGPTALYGSSVPCSPTTPSGTGPVAVSASLSSLTAASGYHFRLFVTTTGSGAITGDDGQFSTTVPPSVTTADSFSDIGSRSATLSGTANPHGEIVTQCHFDFSTDTSFSSFVPCSLPLPSGTTDSPVSAAVTGLLPATAYNVRVSIVTNASGEVDAAAKTLTTTAAPSAATDPATGPGVKLATANGTVNPRGETVTDCHFEYGTSDSYGATKPCSLPLPSGLGPSSVSAPLTGLAPSTGYHVQVVITTNGSGTPVTTTGGDRQFTTTAAPTLSTDPVTDIGSRSATLNGTVVPRGETVTECHFDYGADTNYGSIKACSTTPSGASSNPVSGALTGLAPATGYHVHIHITTSAGDEWTGDDQSFTTTATPSSTADAPTDVSTRTATLNGTVNPRGETVTDCHFDYGTDSNYGSTKPCSLPLPSGLGPSSVSAPLTGLDPSTEYHIRLVIQTNGSGIVESPDRQFKSNDLPTVASAPDTGIRSRSLTLHGTVNPRGESVTDCHFDYGTDSNYGSTKPCSPMPSGTGDVPVSGTLTGLDPSTPYHVRLVMVTNPSGTAQTADRTVTTTQAPAATTDAATGIGHTAGTLNGTVTPHDDLVTDCHFEFGPTDSYGSSVPCVAAPSGAGPVAASAPLTGLPSGAARHYRLFVTTDGGGGPIDGGDRQFSTTVPPSATTGAASDVGPANSTLKGTVNSHGETVTDCHFEYSTDTSFSSSAPCSPSAPTGTSDSPVSAALSGLAPATEYHVRLVITTLPSGDAHGTDQTFTTAPPPSAATDPASSVGQTVATLNGTVNARGVPVTDCHFDYGTTTDYGSVKTCSPLSSGNGSASVSEALTGLSSSATYHFRIVLTTAMGAVNGDDRSFSTTAPSSTGNTGTPGGSPETAKLPTRAQLAAAAKLIGTKTASRKGVVTLGTLGCPGTCGKVKVTVTRTSHGARLVIGKGSSNIKPGKPIVLTFKLTSAGKKALAEAGKLKVSITVALTNADGKTVTVTRPLVLKAKKP